MVIDEFGLLVVLKEILFIKCFIMVCRWWVLIFLVVLLICYVVFVICVILFLVNLIFIFLVFISVMYCFVSDVLGLVRICLKLWLDSVFNLIWIGKWFCSLGIRFEGFVIWKVFEVINKIWLVFIILCFVEMVLFLINGNKLCCIFLWEIFGLEFLLCL